MSKQRKLQTGAQGGRVSLHRHEGAPRALFSVIQAQQGPILRVWGRPRQRRRRRQPAAAPLPPPPASRRPPPPTAPVPLLPEIDQTLRKIWDGVEEWDALWEKLEETEVGGGGAVGWAAQAGSLLLEQSQRCRRQPSSEPIPAPPLASTQDAAQREKIATLMKTELKKLQRLREQVRGGGGGGS